MCVFLYSEREYVLPYTSEHHDIIPAGWLHKWIMYDLKSITIGVVPVFNTYCRRIEIIEKIVCLYFLRCLHISVVMGWREAGMSRFGVDTFGWKFLFEKYYFTRRITVYRKQHRLHGAIHTVLFCFEFVFNTFLTAWVSVADTLVDTLFPVNMTIVYVASRRKLQLQQENLFCS